MSADASHPISPAAGMSGAPDVDVRPRKVRWICMIAAIAIFVVFASTATALTGKTAGGGVFHRSDQVAMVILGALLGLGIMTIARPRVRADANGVRIRNIVGGYQLPWDVVRAVKFNRSSPWASLELADDDEVAVMAIQASDKEYALDAVRALRRLLAVHGGAAGQRGDGAGPHPS